MQQDKANDAVEERSEIEREREEPEGDEDESEPWAKSSTGRDPDE
jgi:hypothetical protein